MQGKDLFDFIMLASMFALIMVTYIGIGIYIAWYTL